MSQHAYVVSRELDRHGYPFEALVMAAMRGADTNNAELLRAAFPEIHAELLARYHAPGGVLETDRQPVVANTPDAPGLT